MGHVIEWRAPGQEARPRHFGPYFSAVEAARDARLITDRIGGHTTVLPLIDPGRLRPLKRRPTPGR